MSECTNACSTKHCDQSAWNVRPLLLSRQSLHIENVTLGLSDSSAPDKINILKPLNLQARILVLISQNLYRFTFRFSKEPIHCCIHTACMQTTANLGRGRLTSTVHQEHFLLFTPKECEKCLRLSKH